MNFARCHEISCFFLKASLLVSERKINMRSYGISVSIDETIDGFCDKLTNELRICQNIQCDSESRFRTIDGCCNNLKKSDLGKNCNEFFHINFEQIYIVLYFLGAPFVPFTRLVPPKYEDDIGLPRGGLRVPELTIWSIVKLFKVKGTSKKTVP